MCKCFLLLWRALIFYLSSFFLSCLHIFLFLCESLLHPFFPISKRMKQKKKKLEAIAYELLFKVPCHSGMPTFFLFVIRSCSVRVQKSAGLLIVCVAVEQDQTSPDHMNNLLIILTCNLMTQVKPKIAELMGIYKTNFIQSLLYSSCS